MQLIKAIAMDVDGVLTDGAFYWSMDGGEWKQFSFYDVMGISLGKKAGLIFALISGEKNALIDRYAEKMGILDVHKNCKEKGAALRAFAKKNGLSLSQVCFIGDDVNDLPALEIAGLSVAPSSAQESVRSRVMIVTKRGGGQGAVREVIDQILAGGVQTR